MSFHFTQTDKIQTLPDSLKAHLPKVIENRIKSFEEVLPAFKEKDFQKICRFCHNIEGVAASYHLFKMDEIVRYIHKLAKEEEFREIEEVLALFQAYLSELKGLST